MDATPSLRTAPGPLGAFQFVVLVLSVFAVGAVIADTFFRLPAEVSRVLEGADLIACGVFFADFVLRFRAAESKAEFMKLGWIDLLASVPNVSILRIGRFVRVLRVLRLLRGIRSLQRLFAVFFESRRQSGTISVGLAAFLLVVFSASGILFCEQSAAGANIRTAGDAVWWSVTTMSTVGYGDRYPVTTEGRAVAMVVMVAGMGMFGALSGLVASTFLGNRETDSVLAEVRALRAELARVQAAGGGPIGFTPDVTESTR